MPEPVSGFDRIDDFLSRYANVIDGAVFNALVECTPPVEGDAQATNAYENDTGATRASTIAYAHDNNDVPDVVYEAMSRAEALRPDSTSYESVPDNDTIPDDVVCLTVMSATEYSYFLNIRNGGASMYLEEALLGNLQFIMTRLEDHINTDVRGLGNRVNPGGQSQG